tara:strand:+ start:207 stop:1214 length:1008 start_codon:yes stop_codon:yes gene_type:complete
MPVTLRGNSFEAAVHFKKKRVRRSFDSKQDAENWVIHTKSALASGQPIESMTSAGTKTWGELLESTYQRYWKDAKSAETLYRNGESVVNFFGSSDPLVEPIPEQVDTFILSLENLGNSNGTINRKLAALSKMLRFAVERSWINDMPKLERKREPQGRIRWLTYDEEETLVAKFRELERNDMADLIIVLIDTGMRVGEALRLQWRDIDNGLISVWVNKSDNPRSIPMTARVKELLESRKSEGFEKPFSPVKQTTFNHVWQYVRSLLGLANDTQFVPHALRHTCASRLVQAGVPLLTVKEFLGHKAIQMTMRYAHLAPQNLVDAVSKLETRNNNRGQ